MSGGVILDPGLFEPMVGIDETDSIAKSKEVNNVINLDPTN